MVEKGKGWGLKQVTELQGKINTPLFDTNDSDREFDTAAGLTLWRIRGCRTGEVQSTDPYIDVGLFVKMNNTATNTTGGLHGELYGGSLEAKSSGKVSLVIGLKGRAYVTQASGAGSTLRMVGVLADMDTPDTTVVTGGRYPFQAASGGADGRVDAIIDASGAQIQSGTIVAGKYVLAKVNNGGTLQAITMTGTTLALENL